MSEFRIGDVARLAGVSISTLRLWEQHGLVQPKRTERGQRVYTAKELQEVHTVVRLRSTEGLNMSAIKRVIGSSVSKPPEAAPRRKSFEHTAGEDQLGQRYRDARRKVGMSLKQAAEKTGLPISYISTFERTNRGATATNLHNLAAVYETTVTALAGGGMDPPPCGEDVVRLGSEDLAPQFDPKIRILQLATRLRTLDCQRWIFAPGSSSEGSYSHEGEEFIHVLKGEFIVTLEGSTQQRLGPGDSISFESHRPHMWASSNREETEVLWVNTPKSF